jgi:glycosyltransferase involved in cell wall biosynthesis
MTSKNTPRFSIVIPAYNEEQYLPRLLKSIEVARSNYSGGRDAIELIVADNDSTDRTAAISAAHGARVVKVAKRRIAAARNGGGHAAQGEIVCFIDGDSAIHPQTFNAIEVAIRSGRYVGGSTGLTLERKSFGLLATYVLGAPLVWITRMDSGVVFCRRDDFEAVGGYDETRLYAEDLVFLMALRRLGQTRGQRLTRLTSIKALGCTRKFDQFGDWHYFGMLGLAIKSLFTGNWHDENLANRYWYKSGR